MAAGICTSPTRSRLWVERGHSLLEFAAEKRPCTGCCPDAVVAAILLWPERICVPVLRKRGRVRRRD
jgi:hypothetical protein